MQHQSKKRKSEKKLKREATRRLIKETYRDYFRAIRKYR